MPLSLRSCCQLASKLSSAWELRLKGRESSSRWDLRKGPLVTRRGREEGLRTRRYMRTRIRGHLINKGSVEARVQVPKRSHKWHFSECFPLSVSVCVGT